MQLLCLHMKAVMFHIILRRNSQYESQILTSLRPLTHHNACSSTQALPRVLYIQTLKSVSSMKITVEIGLAASRNEVA